MTAFAEIIKFTLKLLILTFFITIILNNIAPKIPETEKNKLIAMSFIQNPYVLWKLSEKNEFTGNNAAAIINMEAAIGLLEVNCSSEKTFQKYQQRLEKLIKK